MTDTWGRLFLSACSRTSPDAVPLARFLIDAGANVNTIFDSGKTPLYYAVRYLDVPLAGFLIDRGARVDASASTGWSLLNLALFEAAIKEQPDSVDALKALIPMLHQAGATYDRSDVRAARALVCYGSLSMLHWFFSQGSNPLTVAELVVYLKDNGVDLDALDYSGKTRLYKAVEQGSIEAVRLLLQAGAEPNIIGKAGAPLHVAAHLNDVEIMRALLSGGAKPGARHPVSGATALHCAITSGNLVAVMLLLQWGASLDERDGLGLGVLHKAISAWAKDPTIFSMLVALGADVMSVSGDEFDSLPLLHYAARSGCSGAIEELLSHGVPVDLPAPATSMTALHIACMLGRVACAKVLLTRGADPQRGDNGGNTPLCVAIRQNELEVVRLFASLRCGISTRNARGETPLHYAASGQSVELLASLVEAGAELDARDDDGWTPLFYASQNSVHIAAFLVACGANVNAVDKRRRSPLYVAVQDRRADVVALLLAEGAVESLQQETGVRVTPRELAALKGYVDIEALMRAAEQLQRIP